MLAYATYPFRVEPKEFTTAFFAENEDKMKTTVLAVCMLALSDPAHAVRRVVA
jgi:hypothetical protein